jgi:hypothetical protein
MTGTSAEGPRRVDERWSTAEQERGRAFVEQAADLA